MRRNVYRCYGVKVVLLVWRRGGVNGIGKVRGCFLNSCFVNMEGLFFVFLVILGGFKLVFFNLEEGGSVLNGNGGVLFL